MTFWINGAGEYAASLADGSIAAPPIVTLAQPLGVLFEGGVTGQVTYAGIAPGMLTGVTQVNVQIPAGLSANTAWFEVQVGQAVSGMYLIAIE